MGLPLTGIFWLFSIHNWSYLQYSDFIIKNAVVMLKKVLWQNTHVQHSVKDVICLKRKSELWSSKVLLSS